MYINKSTLILILLSVGVIFTLGTGSVASQEQLSEEWCLEITDTVAEDIIGQCGTSIADHEKVDVNMYSTTNSQNDTVYFTPAIQSQTRDEYEIHFELETLSEGTVDERSETIRSGSVSESFSLSHTTSQTGVIESGLYEITIEVRDLDGNTLSEKRYSSPVLYMDIDNTPQGPEEDSTSANLIGTTTNTDFTVEIDQTQTEVSRYNDGTTDVSELQDPSIPPVFQDNVSTFEQGVGEFGQFEEMLDSEDPLSGDATVRSELIDGQQVINVGTVSYGVPEANDHRLVIDYAMQTDTRSDRAMGVEIVTREGEVIDPQKELENLPSASPRWFGDTIDESFNTQTNDQFELAAEDGLLNTESHTIHLTDAEQEYINNNFEAYIIYRTPSVEDGGSEAGRTVFLPFRSTIISQDRDNLSFEYLPETPEVGQEVSFELTDIPLGFYNPDADPNDPDDERLGELTMVYEDGDIEHEETLDISETEVIDLLENDESIENITDYTFENRGVQSATLVAENVGDTPSNQTTETINVIGEDETPAASPAEFDVYYRVLNETNNTYDMIDVEPTRNFDDLNDPLRVEVVVENPGNLEIERDVTLRDTFFGEGSQYSNEIRDEATVTVSPQERETVTLSTEWSEEYYGEHEITVRDETENEDIIRPETDTFTSNVYVLQPATIRIDDIENPDSHYVEDNWNTSIEVTNVGDLSTEHPTHDATINGWFATTWETEEEVPELSGGDVRSEDDTEGESEVISWQRDLNGEPLNYSPTFPEVTDAERHEADSPWHDETGVFELGFEIEHHFIEGNQARYNELNNERTEMVDIYKAEILYLKENGEIYPFVDDNDTQTFYASGYRYTEDHYTSVGETVVDPRWDNKQKTDWSLMGGPIAADDPDPSAIPTTNMTEVQEPTVRDNGLENRDREMNITVGVDNIGEAETGTARILLRSDQDVYYDEDWSQHPDAGLFEDYEWFNRDYYDDDVVGVAGIDLEAFETRDNVESAEVEVPVVIPNHPENNGTHTIDVEIRHGPDYIQRNPQAGDSQFDYKFDLEVWGDSVYLGYRNPQDPSTQQYEHEVDELCKSDVLDDDYRDTYGLGDCNSDVTQTEYNMEYKNMGGDDVTQEINAHYYHETPSYIGATDRHLADHHIEEYEMREGWNNIMTQDPTGIDSAGDFGDPDIGGNFRKDNSYYWDDHIVTIGPREYHTFKFQNEFLEPGPYTLHVTDHRYAHDENAHEEHTITGLSEKDYNRTFPINDYQNAPWMEGDNEAEIMVWDVTDPEARFNMQDCTLERADWSNTPDLRSEGDTGGSTSANVLQADSGTSYGQCLSDEYNGLGSFSSYDFHGTETDGFSEDGNSVIWEGGVIQFDGAQRNTEFNLSTQGTNPRYDDVNLSYTPEQANDFYVSSDNVGVDYYEWTIYEGSTASGTVVDINRGDQNEHKFRHRFNDPGTYTVELYVEDHEEYVEGQGNVNSDTVTETFRVETDNNNPSTDINELCSDRVTYVHDYNSLTNCWSSNGVDRVWSQGADTDGAHISWGATTAEYEIGIEDLEWSTDYQSGSDFDKTGNWDGSTDNRNLNNNVGPRANRDEYYGTDQLNFDYVSSSSDYFQDVTIEHEVWDFKGENRSDSLYDQDDYTFEVVSDNTSPYTIYCDPSSCSDSTDGGGTASVETEVEDDGPGPDDGIGISPSLSDYSVTDNTSTSVSGGGSPSATATTDYSITITEDDIYAEVEAYTSANADADCSVSCSAPSCGCDSDSCSDTSNVSADASISLTITAIDYHGNEHTQTISASSSDSDSDSYSDSCRSCSSCDDGDD